MHDQDCRMNHEVLHEVKVLSQLLIQAFSHLQAPRCAGLLTSPKPCTLKLVVLH